MVFDSWIFAVFFAAIWSIYALLGRAGGRRSQNLLLLIGSYVFYGWWDWRFCSLLLISTVVDFCVGLWMSGSEGRRRQILLIVSLVTNLGILGVFKYFDFFIDSAAAALGAIGLHAELPLLSLILPVGISFYTFQTMAYSIDVYRGRQQVCRDPVAFALYVAYFPQLVAGPIERASRLIPQLEQDRRVDLGWLSSGLLLALMGLTKKLVIADNLAPIVDAVFADPGAHGPPAVLLGVVLFGVQIYADFSGYSDIARGVSRCFGIELMENFHRPYFATSITSFWRRWHVSLSTWLRDYLYIPLGGNRLGRLKTFRNLMIVMLLGGLWHGASWTFVAWGLIHGVALAIHRAMTGQRVNSEAKDTSASSAAGRAARRLVGWLITMLVVFAAWVFFRAEPPDQLANALDVFRGIADVSRSWAIPGDWLLTALGCGAALAAIDLPAEFQNDHTAPLRWHGLILGAYAAALLLVCATFRAQSDVPFIYFQF